MKTFDDVPPEKHEEIAIKVIRHCLKFYYKLNSAIYPQSSAVRQEDALDTYPDNIFSLKMDIDRAIGVLPLRLEKIIHMFYIQDVPVSKICSLLGFKFRVDFYRKMDEAYSLMYKELGPNWLKSKC